ncbi:fatty acid synthase [Trichonephila inaurata madagascariensis]|uniref:oleoyl-[acyl-carrier-protein] hydrolase n=1 Tax=Trichonephila inaurata madagascariensis TaxID=2747483 RepID=A0A8X6YMQ0_9ARAC|nr:fatty acid synthase [Trichonephila inaurata madagascariensis]
MQKEIVITGISGRFPESDDVAEFSRNLYQKKDLVTESSKRFELGLYGLPKRLGQLKDISRFDNEFFDVSQKQAHLMDPQGRILFETTYEAIVDAGKYETCTGACICLELFNYIEIDCLNIIGKTFSLRLCHKANSELPSEKGGCNPDDLRDRNIGVFIGNSYLESQEFHLYDIESINDCTLFGNGNNQLPNRISHIFDFKGPSVVLDTACSSGMMALYFAVQSILRGEVEVAVVGGVNICLRPGTSINFHKLGALSNESKCKTFDAEAKGYARSEVIAAIFLQKSDAARKKYASIIHIKPNIDGYKEKGLAIQWGPVGDVGVLQDTVGSDVVIGGTISQSIRSRLSVLDKFLQQKHPVVLSCVPYLQTETSSTKISKPSILSAVGKIFGITDISSTNPELSLLEPGMDSLLEVELRHLLERDYDLMIGISEMRKLTVKDLRKLEGSEADNIETSHNSEATEDIPNINVLNIEEVPLLFNTQDKSQLIPKDTIVRLNTVKSGIPLFMIHPIEGTVGMLCSLAQLISVPVFGIQYTAEAPEDSIEQVAAWYWMHIQKINVGNRICLAGYSFGSALVFEMALQAENQPHQYPEVQNIFFLDGSPALLRVYSQKYNSSGVKREIDILFSFVMVLGVELNTLKFKEELMSLSSRTERIKCTAHKLKAFYRNMTAENLQTAFDLFHKKLEMIIKYSPKRKLQKDVILIKAEHSISVTCNISETFDLEKDCDGNITVYTVRGSHKNFIEGEDAKDLALILSDTNSSEMFPDMYLSTM